MTELIKALDLHDRSGLQTGEMVISGSLRNRRRRRAVDPPPCSMIVGGPITPNRKGCYVFAGYYNGRNYYKHREENWYIWYDSSGEPVTYDWIISPTVGGAPEPYWRKRTGSYTGETGDYLPQFGATGTAKVENP